jgi:hypothetical protein
MTPLEAKQFARTKMRSMAKKGAYMQSAYQQLQQEYAGSILRVLDSDVTITHQRLLQFTGFAEGLAGLYIHTLRDHDLFTFTNEEEFCPKVDFHDYNIGRALGILKDANPRKGTTEKKEFSYFLRDLAREEDVNIFELDAFMWAASQFCFSKNETICTTYCPLAQHYTRPRAHTLQNDYAARSKKAKQIAKKEEAMKQQLTLF